MNINVTLAPSYWYDIWTALAKQ